MCLRGGDPSKNCEQVGERAGAGCCAERHCVWIEICVLCSLLPWLCFSIDVFMRALCLDNS